MDQLKKAISKRMFTLIITGLGLIILFQNTQIISLNVFFWEIEISQVTLILLMILFGFGAGYLTHLRNRQRKSQNGSGSISQAEKISPKPIENPDKQE